MRLEYHILWIEDSKDWLSEAVLGIKEYILDQSYIPNIETISSNFQSADNLKKISSNKYDLILIDYQLTWWINGEQLIEIIRNCNIYTDIIFYSTATENTLRNLVHNKNIEWVYISNRSDAPFRAKVEKLIYKTITRNLLPNNFRWLLMNESCEIEFLVNDIIYTYYNSATWDIKNELTDHIYNFWFKDKYVGNWEKAYNKLLREEGIMSIVTHSFFELNEKLALINGYIKVGQVNVTDLTLFEKLYEEIFVLRNQMAHQKIKEDLNTWEYSFYHQTKKSKQIIDPVYVKDTRSKIIAHKNNFKKR